MSRPLSNRLPVVLYVTITGVTVFIVPVIWLGVTVVPAIYYTLLRPVRYDCNVAVTAFVQSLALYFAGGYPADWR